MNSDFLCFCITYLFREPRSIVGVAPSRERVGAYRTTHLIPLGMVQAPGLGHAGQRRIEGQAVCRPRGVEHRQDVPRVRMHSNLGEKTSRAPALLFAAILLQQITSHKSRYNFAICEFISDNVVKVTTFVSIQKALLSLCYKEVSKLLSLLLVSIG